MSTTPSCEIFEVELSALADAELESERRPEVIDHLAECGACCDYYRRIRRLDRMLSAQVGSLDGPRIEPADSRADGARAASRGLARLLPRWRAIPGSLPNWAWAMGAVALVAVLVLQLPNDTFRSSPSDAVFINLEGSPEAMDDDRFVELLTELLQADRRYHRAMLRALEQIQPFAYIPEGSSEGTRPAVAH